MTNYNDGKWHGWNGGDCPVHLESLVDHVWKFDAADGPRISFVTGTPAGDVAFLGNKYGRVIAFRVVKEHREPREWWLHFAGAYRNVYTTREDAQAHVSFNRDATIIHVREVLE